MSAKFLGPQPVVFIAWERALAYAVDRAQRSGRKYALRHRGGGLGGDPARPALRPVAVT